MDRLIKNFDIQKYGALIVLVLLVVINIIITPNFFQVTTLWNIVIQAFIVVIVGMGMTLVVSTGGIDISVGSTVAITAIVFAKMLIQNEMSIGVSIAVAMGVTLLVGLFNGILIGIFEVQPIVTTLIMMIAGRGIAQQLNDGGIISFYGNPYMDLGTYRVGGLIPIQVVIILIVAAAVIFIVRKTSYGTFVQAVGDNPNATFVSGVNTRAVIISVYAICAVLAGVASVIEALRTGAADPSMFAKGLELDCIAAVTVGGTSMQGGKAMVVGTIIGAFIMQLITTMVNMNDIRYTYSLLIKAVVIIVALYLQNRNKK